MAKGKEDFSTSGFAKAGDDNPYPLAIVSGGRKVGAWVPGRAAYRAFQIGPFVSVVAVGETSHFNVEVQLTKSPVTVFPPEFGLFFFLPEAALPATKPFTVTTSFFSQAPVQAIVVWDAAGKHAVPVIQSPK